MDDLPAVRILVQSLPGQKTVTPELQMLIDGVAGYGRVILLALQLLGLVAAIGLTTLFFALALHRWLKGSINAHR